MLPIKHFNVHAPWLRCAVNCSFGALQLTSVCGVNGDRIRSSITFYEPLTRLKLHHHWLRRRRVDFVAMRTQPFNWFLPRLRETMRREQMKLLQLPISPHRAETFQLYYKSFNRESFPPSQRRRNNDENYATQHESHFQWARTIFLQTPSKTV